MIFEAQKCFIALMSRVFFQLYAKGHICNTVLVLVNVVKFDVENLKAFSTLSNVVNINVEIDNVDSTLFNVVSFNIDLHNVVSTLIWRCSTSRRHVLVFETTLKCLLAVFQYRHLNSAHSTLLSTKCNWILLSQNWHYCNESKIIVTY